MINEIQNKYSVRKINDFKYVISIPILDRHFVITNTMLDFINFWRETNNFNKAASKHTAFSKQNKEDIFSFTESALYKCLTSQEDLINSFSRQKYLKFKRFILKEKINIYFCKSLKHLINPYVLTSSILLFAIIILYINSGYSKISDLKNEYNIYIFSVYFIFTIFLHEYGHVAALNKYTGHVAKIGFGIYLFRPVLFADVSMAWTLNKQKRIIINFAGLYFEFILLIVFSIFSLLFQIYNAETLIVIYFIRLLYNLNPFIRSDGYWVISDLFNIPNLKNKSDKQLKEVTLKRKKPYNTALLIYGITGYVFIIIIVSNVLVNHVYSFTKFPYLLVKAIFEEGRFILFIKENVFIAAIYIIIGSWLIHRITGVIKKRNLKNKEIKENYSISSKSL